jgi:aldehyde dehydrogenase (NAD+)
VIVGDLLARLGIAESNSGACGREWMETAGAEIASHNPDNWSVLAAVRSTSGADCDRVIAESTEVFQRWRATPAPVRGEIVREIGDELRARKSDLGALVTLETGKILAEGEGEVQEMIDISVFAAGLSRQLYGKTMHSERAGHRMYEQWHPLGPVGVISAFNFPVAVWSWNALIAAVCGDTVVWKPSPRTPLTALAVQRIATGVAARRGFAGVFSLVIGSNAEIGDAMLRDRRLPLISFTGSSAVGRHVATVVGERLGRTLLELGGNNGLVVMNDADPDLALRAVLFGAVGTAGQRCTTTRRLFVQSGIAAGFIEKLKTAYQRVRIGNPMEPETILGPLISPAAVDRMMEALDTIRTQGGNVEYGGCHLGGCFVEPAIVRARHDMPIVREEIFAPILYAIEFDDLDDVIAWHNAVPQGLSSAIFTRDLLAAETFLSHAGSDCGIANVNVGTSGAEIGGAFGGEKDTGGGREAGSDSWKAYMRRQTVTINWSKDLPLAQGIPGMDIDA